MSFLSTQISSTHTTSLLSKAMFDTHTNNNLVVVKVTIRAEQNGVQENDFVLDSTNAIQTVNLVENNVTLNGKLTYDSVSNAVKFQGRFVVSAQVFNQLDIIVAAL